MSAGEKEDNFLWRKWKAVASLAASLQILSFGNVAGADTRRENDVPNTSDLQSQLQMKLLRKSVAGSPREKEVPLVNVQSFTTDFSSIKMSLPSSSQLKSGLDNLAATSADVASKVAVFSDATLRGMDTLAGNVKVSVLAQSASAEDVNVALDKIKGELQSINNIELPSLDASIAKARTSVTSVIDSMQMKAADSVTSSSVYSFMQQEASDFPNQLKDIFTAKIPESSRILTTTIRPEQVAESSSQKKTWIRSAAEDLQTRDFSSLSPDSIDASVVEVQQLMGSLTRDWRVAPLVLGVIIFADAMQHSSFLSSIVEDQKQELLALRKRLQQVEALESNSTKLLDTMKQESLTLLNEVDSLLTELESRTAEVASLNATLTGLGGKVDTGIVASLRNEVATIGSKLVEARGELFQLKKAKKVGDDESRVKIEQLQLQVKSLQETQNKVFTVIKSFLVEEDYITAELADEVFVAPENVVQILGDADSSVLRQNRLKLGVQNEELRQQMNTAQGQIATLQDQLQKGLQLTTSYDSVLNKLRDRIDSLEGQLVGANKQAQEAQFQENSLRTQLSSLAAKVAQLEESADKKQEVKQYVGDLAAENDDLKIRLMSGDDKIFDMQQEMQEKLNEANAKVKDLKILLKNSIRSKKDESLV